MPVNETFSSSPDLDHSVASDRVNGRVILVKDEVIDGTFVRLERITDLLTFNIDKFDVTIAASDRHLLTCLIELANVCNCIACVNVDNLLHHTDVPNFDDTVRVTGRDVLSTDREATVIDRIQMTEECLDCEACTHIPN